MVGLVLGDALDSDSWETQKLQRSIFPSLLSESCSCLHSEAYGHNAALSGFWGPICPCSTLALRWPPSRWLWKRERKFLPQTWWAKLPVSGLMDLPWGMCWVPIQALRAQEECEGGALPLQNSSHVQGLKIWSLLLKESRNEYWGWDTHSKWSLHFYFNI